jgi:hypothetical protein
VIQGEDEDAAVLNAFASPIGAEFRRADADKPPSERQWSPPDLRAQKFFARRWLVSAMAAAIEPVFGLRSLLTVSLLAYLLLGPALYLLLRRRFSPGISTAVAAICVLAPPVREHSFMPMTDSSGILLETLALLAASLALERGNRWLIPWIAAVAALSFTRDYHLVPLIGVVCVALHQRDRRSALVAGSGIAAALPAPLILGGASVRENLAYVLSGFDPDAPADASWGFIMREYPPQLWDMIHFDVYYGSNYLGWEAVPWYVGLALAGVGLLLLVFKGTPAADPFFRLQRYSWIGAVAAVAAAGPQESFFRLELVFLPLLAVALALVAQRVLSLLRGSTTTDGPYSKTSPQASG